MKRQSIRANFQGRLFQLMIVAVFTAVLLFSAASLYLTHVGFDSLQSAVTEDLRAGQRKTSQTLEENLVQVSESVAKAQQDTATALSDHLNNRMTTELTATEASLHSSLMETAEALATLLAEVAPEAILGNRFADLVGYTKVANRNRHVVYAVFERPDGRPYTRYVNADNPRVSQLIGKGSG